MRYRYPIAVLLLLCWLPHAAAAVRTFVDPKVLDETETLRLTLRLEGTNSASAPDLSALQQDFEVLGSSSSSKYRSINGQVQAWVEFQISLRPKTAGILTIPAIELGGERSDATQVEVRALDPVLRQEIDRMVFFETEVSPDPVFVQGELTFVRRLFYSTSGGVQMYSDLPGAPDIADAIVVPLSDAESFAVRRSDIDYGVVEQRFAIYPERSGTLTIPSVSLTSSVRILKDGRMRRSGIRISSDVHAVSVLPIPPEYPADAPWLPATAVTLQQSIEPRGSVGTGTSIERRVRATVSGNVSSAIAPLATTATAANLSDHFREYPQAPVTSDQVRGDTNIGERSETTTLLAVRPGQLALPAYQITWWDTRTATVRTTRAAPINLQIIGEAVADGPLGEEQESGEDALQPADADQIAPVVTPVEPLSNWPRLLAALAIFGLLALTVSGYRHYPQWRPAILLAKLRGSSPAPSITQTRRQLSARLKESTTPHFQRQALLQALATIRGCSTAEAASVLDANPDSTELIRTLDTHCYGGTDASTRNVTADAIVAAFEACLPTQLTRPKSALPPLYPVTATNASRRR